MRRLKRLILITVLALAALSLAGCTTGLYRHKSACGDSTWGLYGSLLQKKSAKVKTPYLDIDYNTDSDAAAGVLLQGIQLGRELAGAAGKAAM